MSSDYDEALDDEVSIRERVETNPRPALFWLLGAGILFALEFSRYLGWLVELGSAAKFVFDGVAALPGWIGGNVASTLGRFAGALASDLTALVMLFVVSMILVALVLPGRLIDRFDVDLTRRGEFYAESALVTVILAIVASILAFTPLGSLVSHEISFTARLLESIAAAVPHITSPDLIPNMGHRTPDGGWAGTFMGLSPAVAWGIRVTIVFAYVGACVAWAWRGYNVYRDEYRQADWTPRDDTIRRFRNHYWGLFGLAIVLLFVVMALWASAISPVPVEENVYEPYNHEFDYLTEDGEIESTTHGSANVHTRSDGQNTVSPLSYDQYDRWAPLGTTPRGQDLLTNLTYGAQTSLVIGLTAIGLGALIAVILSLITAYYKGLADMLTVIASDTIIAIPAFLLVMLMSVLFTEANHPVAQPLDGGILLALIFAFAYWPGMWRAIRGPSLQVAEQDWVDAAKSYGQSPLRIMQKHMSPYIAGYIMIYASLLLGGVIIATAALTFLGLGISAPTPEWGRLIDQGQPYVATSSYHVATISGIMIVLVVTAFNALGDGIRDAIDPEADVGEGADSGAAGGGA
ncbi:ABC transporter permease [Natranaeroarchaeum sulfidigenes]|uniref:ABC-type dipeptide/oligopeptide/nickel transportsystem, permease component n=1 Tax=Natranaeroarchaeum sulfidigenes TaxID=2784880 RepID=A0A897MRP7_9EURY|nr:ABC transporter permease [Natranaeroarchaeum sulfidigenes]QSG03092.1 ABC-type dipeptide/oligopeptide/nickel transportsystem, permease component [Natranaeroarchaeum sulfidigenes]